MRIEGSVAVVTGANRGIGRALVDALVERGARKVYAVSRRPLEPKGVVVPLRADITRPEEVAAVADAVKGVTLLINNAGVAAFGGLLDSPLEVIRRDMETNYFGTLNVVRAILPKMEKEEPAAIVNVLTIASLAGMAALAGYSASKAAAHSATQALRAHLQGSNVRVHGVYPGPVDTEMARELPMEKSAPSDVARCILLGIEGDVEDIFPDVVASDVERQWFRDPKGVERRFAEGRI